VFDIVLVFFNFQCFKIASLFIFMQTAVAVHRF
jgi:hypothetical protein